MVRITAYSIKLRQCQLHLRTVKLSIACGSNLVLCVQVKIKTWSKGFDRVAFDDVVACPSANGNGFAILNNVVGNMRGRGALVKSSDGVIANNIFFNLMYWAIELAPEWGWKESGFVHNVLIANNSINSNGTGIWLGVDPWTWGVPPTYKK